MDLILDLVLYWFELDWEMHMGLTLDWNRLGLDLT